MATVNSMKALGRLVIVKATKGGGGTDTILYSQHATKISSHNGQGNVDYYQTSQVCGPGFELNLFWKSNTYLISLQGLIFLLFTHFHH